MLMIRFQRVGRRNDPAFRVVVTERHSKPKSGEIEILGSYHPKTKATALNAERILYWIGKGAKCSPTVHNLLITKGVIQGNKISVVQKAVVVSEIAKADKEAPVLEVKTVNAEMEPAAVKAENLETPEPVVESDTMVKSAAPAA